MFYVIGSHSSSHALYLYIVKLYINTFENQFAYCIARNTTFSVWDFGPIMINMIFNINLV
jgi:hypothetical protein